MTVTRQSIIGRRVVYRPKIPCSISEEGIVTSANHRFVFVRFNGGATSIACNPEDLTFIDGSPVDCRSAKQIAIVHPNGSPMFAWDGTVLHPDGRPVTRQ